uniref:peptide-methionine (S)-S-oxide reductase n=1 Tax=Oryza meridionalis TaxID=40149 RepID=A0A0E0DFB3_9ORYZ
MSNNTGADGGAANPALGPDADAAAGEGLELAQFTAGCFWSVELTYQRLPGVARTEVVRVHYDPKACPYGALLDVFWAKHRPTKLIRQGDEAGTQYRSGIYYYTAEQERVARESLEAKQEEWKEKIVTEILPARRFYPAEEYHQRYLEKGGQSAQKSCTDPIRRYG